METYAPPPPTCTVRISSPRANSTQGPRGYSFTPKILEPVMLICEMEPVLNRLDRPPTEQVGRRGSVLFVSPFHHDDDMPTLVSFQFRQVWCRGVS